MSTTGSCPVNPFSIQISGYRIHQRAYVTACADNVFELMTGQLAIARRLIFITQRRKDSTRISLRLCAFAPLRLCVFASLRDKIANETYRSVLAFAALANFNALCALQFGGKPERSRRQWQARQYRSTPHPRPKPARLHTGPKVSQDKCQSRGR